MVVMIPFGFVLYPAGAVIGFLLLAVFGVGLGSFSYALAIAVRKQEWMFWVVQQTLIFPLMILSGMLLPLESGPGWMQVASTFQPVDLSGQCRACPVLRRGRDPGHPVGLGRGPADRRGRFDRRDPVDAAQRRLRICLAFAAAGTASVPSTLTIGGHGYRHRRENEDQSDCRRRRRAARQAGDPRVQLDRSLATQELVAGRPGSVHRADGHRCHRRQLGDRRGNRHRAWRHWAPPCIWWVAKRTPCRRRRPRSGCSNRTPSWSCIRPTSPIWTTCARLTEKLTDRVGIAAWPGALRRGDAAGTQGNPAGPRDWPSPPTFSARCC